MGDIEGIKRETVKGKMPVDRILGRYSSGVKGPGLIIIADTLGNVSSGILAFFNVMIPRRS